MTYLISLISDHMLPNYLLMREMEGKYDEHIFITTAKMKGLGRGRRLEHALGLPEKSVRRVLVSEDDLNEMLDGLEAEYLSKEDRFIVNITCGTKIMAIGVYEFFSKFTSSFYYVPIGKSKIENVRTSEDIPLTYHVNLQEYFTLYGLRFEFEPDLYYPAEHTFELFKRFRKANFDRYKVPEIVNAQTFDEKNSRYYSGIWFEEYTYLRIKEEKELDEKFICKGAKIFRPDSGNSNDNEIDVMYMNNNQLYVGECKVSMIGAPGSSSVKLLEQYIYELAAISKDFGLIVNPYLFTLHRFNRISPLAMQAIEKRMKILGIKGILENEAFKQQKLDI